MFGRSTFTGDVELPFGVTFYLCPTRFSAIQPLTMSSSFSVDRSLAQGARKTPCAPQMEPCVNVSLVPVATAAVC